MVYINSRGEVIDETRPTPSNIFWRIIEFFVLFFKSLIGIEDKPDKKNEDRGTGPGSGSGGFFGGGGGGGGTKKPGDGKGSGPRQFGPRGFRSITDLPPPPMVGGCSGGACG